MSNFIVVNNKRNWQFNIPGVEVISARDYLLEDQFIRMRGARIFNLCRSYRYQSIGYYVSLLASARGHKAFPNVTTIQEMKTPHVIRVLAEDLDKSIQRSLAPVLSDTFVLSIYFGKNISKRYDRLCLQIYNLFQAPLIRVFFSRKGNRWKIQNIQLISANDIPEEHQNHVIDFATQYFSRRITGKKRRPIAPYDMAILVNDGEPTPPSNRKAIDKFIKAGEKTGFNVELIDKDDLHRIAEFDALFIRETTSVNHYTFRFAQRAAAEGLVVIDDPDSIIKCTNKVYLAELMNHYRIPVPKTVVISRDTLELVLGSMELPLILKQPDSSYSQGVLKVETKSDYFIKVNSLLEKSDLIIAQEFIKTDYDWRVGIIDGMPLYVCKYYMAEDHWQIVNWAKHRKSAKHSGRGETLRIDDVPKNIIRTALKAAENIGHGFYGVDLKVVGSKCFVIEVNDNPSVDFGVEDKVLKDELYETVMKVFYEKVKLMKENSAN